MEEQTTTMKEIRNEWSSLELKLIEIENKLEDNGLIENKFYIWRRPRIFNLIGHSRMQSIMLTIGSVSRGDAQY
jgi:hypothetical protein